MANLTTWNVHRMPGAIRCGGQLGEVNTANAAVFTCNHFVMGTATGTKLYAMLQRLTLMTLPPLLHGVFGERDWSGRKMQR